MSETWKKIAEAPDHDVYVSNLGNIAWVALTKAIVIEKAFDRYGRLIYDRHGKPQLVKEKPNAAGE